MDDAPAIKQQHLARLEINALCASVGEEVQVTRLRRMAVVVSNHEYGSKSIRTVINMAVYVVTGRVIVSVGCPSRRLAVTGVSFDEVDQCC
jgi:hypothetical protein